MFTKTHFLPKKSLVAAEWHEYPLYDNEMDNLSGEKTVTRVKNELVSRIHGPLYCDVRAREFPCFEHLL